MTVHPIRCLPLNYSSFSHRPPMKPAQCGFFVALFLAGGNILLIFHHLMLTIHSLFDVIHSLANKQRLTKGKRYEPRTHQDAEGRS